MTHPPEPTTEDRVDRIVDAVRAHGVAIEATTLGALRISWADGDLKVVLESHFPKEPRRVPPNASSH